MNRQKLLRDCFENLKSYFGWKGKNCDVIYHIFNWIRYRFPLKTTTVEHVFTNSIFWKSCPVTFIFISHSVVYRLPQCRLNVRCILEEKSLFLRHCYRLKLLKNLKHLFGIQRMNIKNIITKLFLHIPVDILMLLWMLLMWEIVHKWNMTELTESASPPPMMSEHWLRLWPISPLDLATLTGNISCNCRYTGNYGVLT